jgi:hypothetical protein
VNIPVIGNRLRAWFFVTLLALSFVLTGLAQKGVPVQEPQQQAPQSAPSQETQPGQPPPKPEAEHHLTQAEAEQLFKSVDEILAFVSKDTGLPIKEPVKRKLVTREEVGRFLEERMKDDKDTEKLERSEASLKKFRLLPKDFDLRPFLVTLMKEQVAGYYDPKTKTVNLLDWVAAEEQKPVMAHELTHALQDQNYGMEKWMEAGDKPKTIQEEIEQDERRAAREAVIEGQGMIVLLDYMMRPQGIRVTDAPLLVQALRQGMNLQVPDSPVFSNAPLFLRDSMLFPYSSGMDFVLQVELKRGNRGGFASVLQTPPTTTRNILEPETYLAKETIPNLKVADFDKLLGKSWQRWDYGFMGEYDIQLLFKQWGDATKPEPALPGVSQPPTDDISPTWRGGYYVSYKKPDTKPPANGKLDTANLALVYVSKWASPQAAKLFADGYGKALAKRYKKVSVTKSMAEGTRGEWSTEEGPVIIETRGDLVVLSESFDPSTFDKLRDAALAELKQ